MVKYFANDVFVTYVLKKVGTEPKILNFEDMTQTHDPNSDTNSLKIHTFDVWANLGTLSLVCCEEIEYSPMQLNHCRCIFVDHVLSWFLLTEFPLQMHLFAHISICGVRNSLHLQGVKSSLVSVSVFISSKRCETNFDDTDAGK